MAPHGIALDSDGTLYIADRDNVRVRRVDAASGNITTIAGNGPSVTPAMEARPPTLISSAPSGSRSIRSGICSSR